MSQLVAIVDKWRIYLSHNECQVIGSARRRMGESGDMNPGFHDLTRIEIKSIIDTLDCARVDLSGFVLASRLETILWSSPAIVSKATQPQVKQQKQLELF